MHKFLLIVVGAALTTGAQAGGLDVREMNLSDVPTAR